MRTGVGNRDQRNETKSNVRLVDGSIVQNALDTTIPGGYKNLEQPHGLSKCN